ncbi:MAG: molybdenum cofactor biosynthesis protein [Planctomycetes bacterium]|nr:molybdenum cofactor biosynthesis protein [Planctomycetota bacterium]
MNASVLTISDRCARGEAEDTSGPALCQMLRETFGATVLAARCVADDPDAIGHVLVEWSDATPRPDLVLTTGGTGLGPRDVTPEATRRVLEREHPGLIQLMQMRCYAKTPKCFLSRGIAGTIDRTLVINLPGSRKGAIESLEALADVLPHAIETLRGGDHARK